MDTGGTMEAVGPPWLMITSLLIGVPLVLLANQLSQHANADAVRAAQFQSQAQNIQQLAQSAHDLGVQANAELTCRGLTPVVIHTPGTAPDSQVLAAASTAQVAAKIVSESPAAPTPAQIQADVAAALATLPLPPVGPAPQQLTAGGAGLRRGQRPGTAGTSG
jgi:hypothetical protein